MGKCLWAQFWFGFRGPEKTREVGTWFISSLALQLGSVMALGCSCQLLTSPVARKWREKSTRHIVEMWSEVLRLFGQDVVPGGASVQSTLIQKHIPFFG